MKLTVGEFGCPSGTYLAKFLGCEARDADPDRLGQDGRPFPPGLEWKFEIVDGPQTAKIASCTTSQNPTAKNSCGRMVQQMTGGGLELRRGAEFDPDTYKGKLFNVIVGPNSTGNGTRINTVMPYGGATPSAAPSPPRPPARPAAPAEAKLWVAMGTADPELMTHLQLQAKIMEDSLNPKDISVCPEGENAWKTADAFGFKDPVPY